MKLEWKVSPRDVEKVRAIIERQASSPLVQHRLGVNLAKIKPPSFAGSRLRGSDGARARLTPCVFALLNALVLPPIDRLPVQG